MFPVLALDEIIQNHVRISEQLSSLKVLKHFKNYLEHGYYPFFNEGIEDYLSKVNNVIEKVICEDIAVIFNLRQSTLPILKKFSGLLPPRMDWSQISIISAVVSEYLARLYTIVWNIWDIPELIRNLYPAGAGMKIIRKPGKIYLNNTNLLNAINGSLKKDSGSGGIRETYFANQMGSFHKINLHGSADFIVDDSLVVEVGGRGKNQKQIEGIENAILALDDIEIGFRNKIPLYLFGFLY